MKKLAWCPDQFPCQHGAHGNGLIDSLGTWSAMSTTFVLLRRAKMGRIQISICTSKILCGFPKETFSFWPIIWQHSPLVLIFPWLIILSGALRSISLRYVNELDPAVSSPSWKAFGAFLPLQTDLFYFVQHFVLEPLTVGRKSRPLIIHFCFISTILKASAYPKKTVEDLSFVFFRKPEFSLISLMLVITKAYIIRVTFDSFLYGLNQNTTSLLTWKSWHTPFPQCLLQVSD